MVKVQVGAEQDGVVEILKGLTKGQSVVTVGNYELSDASAIKTAEGDKADDKKGADTDKSEAKGKPDTADKPDEKGKSDEKPTGAAAK